MAVLHVRRHRTRTTTVPPWVLRSMAWPLGMRGWALVTRPAAIRLGLGQRADTHSEGHRNGDRGRQALQLHGATFLSEKDSSPNGCHTPIMRDKCGLHVETMRPLPNFAQALGEFAQALQMQNFAPQ